MGGLNFAVHPLFFLFGIYYSLTGRIFVFIIYTVCAVIHELGHSFAASSVGYKLNKITLMPFGAVVSGNIDGLNVKDEIKIALAGPFINLCIALLFIALWWMFPEIYAFTDVVVEANLSLALVNFLPVYPLDGGRVLSATLCGAVGKDRAFIISKIIGGIFALLLLAGFVITLFGQMNLSLLFFSLFVTFGAFSKNKENKYVRVYTAMSEERLTRGLPVKKYAVHKNTKVKRILAMLDETAVNEVAVFDGERQIANLTQDRIGKILEKGKLYSSVGEFL